MLCAQPWQLVVVQGRALAKGRDGVGPTSGVTTTVGLVHEWLNFLSCFWTVLWHYQWGCTVQTIIERLSSASSYLALEVWGCDHLQSPPRKGWREPQLTSWFKWPSVGSFSLWWGSLGIRWKGFSGCSTISSMLVTTVTGFLNRHRQLQDEVTIAKEAWPLSNSAVVWSIHWSVLSVLTWLNRATVYSASPPYCPTVFNIGDDSINIVTYN